LVGITLLAYVYNANPEINVSPSQKSEWAESILKFAENTDLDLKFYANLAYSSLNEFVKNL